MPWQKEKKKAVEKESNWNIKDPALELCQVVGKLLESSQGQMGWLLPQFMFFLYMDSMDSSSVQVS